MAPGPWMLFLLGISLGIFVTPWLFIVALLPILLLFWAGQAK